MGSGEAATQAKAPKTSSAQEQPSPPPYPEWAAAFQAFYNGGTPPPGYFPPSVSGPQPHPYMWGAQPMMPPYGTPPPYGTMYPPPYGMPPGPHPYGQYGMPVPGSTNDASATATTDDGKSSDGKERSPAAKRSKGSVSKAAEGGNKSAGNGVVSQSGESASEGSSGDGSDDDQNGTEKRNSEQANVDGSGAAAQPGYPGQVNSAFASPGVPPGGKAPVGTSLNMGMDYWGGTPSGAPSTGKGKRNSQALVAGMPSMTSGRDGVPPELWLQDERELKRQRRKQSNRESARRSRLRKQAECEELSQRVDSLNVENLSLRQELEQVMEERNKLLADNASLMEQLQKSGRGGDTELANSDAVEADENGAAAAAAQIHERNGRVEGENCETIGKVPGLEAAPGAGRAEAVAAAG